MKASSFALAFCAAALACGPAARAQGGPVSRGEQLYSQGCIGCHGADGRGVARGTQVGGYERGAEGPPLRGVGAQAADFYLRTGYMPLQQPDARPRRSRVYYSRQELDALIAYVASLGAGPRVPRPQPDRGSLSEGMRLFTENCAGCHQIVAKGGIATTAVAPSLERASPTQIAEAVRIGPYLMPRFSRRQITDRQLDSIVRYVELTKNPRDRGGWSIGHIGPIPEGLVAWLVAGTALVAVARAIGERAK